MATSAVAELGRPHLPAFAVTPCAMNRLWHSVPQLTQRLPPLLWKEVLVPPSHLLGLVAHEVVDDAVIDAAPAWTALAPLDTSLVSHQDPLVVGTDARGAFGSMQPAAVLWVHRLCYTTCAGCGRRLTDRC
jgi:hypothetical protein